MSKLRQRADIERRIIDEIVVDAYTEEERALGWYYYVEDKLKPPFTALCIVKRESSPLCKVETVDVIGIASEDECRHELLVSVRWAGQVLALPLAQLTPQTKLAATQQAVADWHYWVGQRYVF
jgi:hypothetical protein